MKEYMASAAQQFEDENQLPDFQAEDVEMAINEATSPEEKFAQIERKYGIQRDVMERLESSFDGITQEALMPSSKPSHYQAALHDLLNLVEETLIMNQKTMPYEHPRLPSKLPLRVAKMIYPDFEPTKKEQIADADVMAEQKAVAISHSPEGVAAKVKNLTDFFDEEERRIKDPAYAAQKRIEEKAAFEKALNAYLADSPNAVVTSVKGDIGSLLKAVPAVAKDPEEIDLTDDIDVVYEDAPATVREVRKTA
jgi:hypothetical protein